MKKVLILCYDFPPLTSAGAIRPYAWHLYSRKYGFEPVVVCRSWPFPVSKPEDRFKTAPSDTPYKKEETEHGTIYYVNHKNTVKERIMLRHGLDRKRILRKLLSLGELLGRFTFPILLDDKYEMYQAAREIVQQEKPDIIIASGEPHILFTYAYKLYKEFNIPYVLDYRDGWYTNQVRNREGFFNKQIQRLDLKYELQSLAHSKFFISVTSQFVAAIQKDVLNHTGYIIPNGIELSLYDNITTHTPTDKFILTYTGTTYDMGYDVILVEGLKKFLAHYQPNDFELRFHGIDFNANRVVDVIHNLAKELPQYVKVLPRKPSRQIIEEQLNSTALLLLIPGSLVTGMIVMKIYEYLASHRPIIVVPSEPERRTPIFPDKDYLQFALTPDEFAETLGALYTRYKKGDNLRTAITDEEIYSISRERSTQLLMEKVKEVLE